jgi:uncharacterized protein
VNRIVAGVPSPDDIRSRLRRSLGDALKARDAGTVSALRSAMSAISNAEAAGLRHGTRALLAALEDSA